MCTRLTTAERRNLEEELRKRKGRIGNKSGIREIERILRQDDIAQGRDGHKGRGKRKS